MHYEGFRKIRLFEDGGNIVYMSAPLKHQDRVIKLFQMKQAALVSAGCVSTLETTLCATAKAVMMQCCDHATDPGGSL